MITKSTAAHILFAAAALVGVFYAVQLVVNLASLWLLAFGSVVVAVILRSIADPLVRHAKLKDGLATLVAVLIVVAIIGLIGFMFGSTLAAQAEGLAARLPVAWADLTTRLEASPIGGQVKDITGAAIGQAGHALVLLQKFAFGVLSGVTTLVLVVVAGIFLAIHPSQGREGLLALFPKDARPRLREVLNTCGKALKGWLRAQMISMILVGTLVGVGLWIIGVPSPLALGVLTGLAQFIPVVGPIISAVPGLLVASTGGPQTVLLTLALYVGVSQLEANLITPLVQRNVAALPVVLGIFSVVGIGTLFGGLGVLFATPMALVLYTMVTMLYRQDVLNDEAAVAPGQTARLKDTAEAGENP